MLHSAKNLEGFEIGATDGTIGKVLDFYFDDEAWVMRYVVVTTSTWLGGREVLVSPYSLGRPDWAGRILPIKVTKDQIKNSPGVDTEKPVSRQYERGYLGYYGYPIYWGGEGLWGEGYYPGMLTADTVPDSYRGYSGYLKAPSDDTTKGDRHLRSCEEVKGYRIQADDGELGHVQGFIVDDHTWSIRYLIVNTSNWWVGHQVLVSPEWIEDVNWAESTVRIDLMRQAIKDSPVYVSDELLDRNAETRLYEHYDRQGYWLGEPRRAVA